MSSELLTPQQMTQADRIAIADGPHDGYGLMRNAGGAIAAAILERFPAAPRVHVLCGPGNNGGDGYVVARLLAASGVAVRVHADAPPRPGGDAARAMADWGGTATPLADFAPRAEDLVVDGLFGAGLSKDIDGAAAEAIARTREAGATVVAIDLPSGVSGRTGAICGAAFEAALTVTFFRKKPGHVLYPGRALCGELVVADIGIPAAALETIAPQARENLPAAWRHLLPVLPDDTHKYRRGSVGVFSGGPSATGAARLAAIAALRAGAGAVTVLSPPEALLVNAAQLTAVMLKRVDGLDELAQWRAAHPAAFVLGPGFGVGEKLRDFALSLLEGAPHLGLVLDADGITAFRDERSAMLFDIAANGSPLVLTPHEGEFARLFADLAAEDGLSRIERAVEAAGRAGAIVIYKGPDTVIAAPDGRAAVNTNGTPLLATAGSGDTLAGLVAGLLAQRMPAFEAACAAVWIHAEAARRFGPGLVAEDLAGLVPGVLAGLTAV